MFWQATPYTLPLIILAALSLLLSLYLWTDVQTLGARLGSVIIMAGGWWMLGMALELASVELAAKVFWTQMQYIGIAVMPTGWLLLTFHSLGYQKWFQKRRIVLLSIIPILSVVAALTNEVHGLFWPYHQLVVQDSLTLLTHPHGIAYWIFNIYSYGQVLFSSVVLLWAAFISRQLFRRQARVMLAAVAMIWLATVLDVLLSNHDLLFNPMPIAWVMVVMLILWGTARLGTGDIIPVARQVIVDSIEDGVLVLDVRNRVVDLNQTAQRLFASTIEDAIGQPVDRLWKSSGVLDEADAEKTRTSTRELSLIRDGQQHVYDVRFSPIRDWRQRTAGCVIVLREITRRKEAERQSLELALEKQRTHLLSEFIRDASHEFRTPLAAINTSVYLMDKTTEPERRRQYVQQVENQVQNVTALVDDLVTMSRLDSGVSLTFEPVNLNNLVRMVLEKFEAERECKRLSIALELDASLPLIEAVPHDLHLAIDNLLENAIRFTPGGGRIMIRTHVENHRVVVTIRDTGIGIDKAHLAHIFERFYRVDSAHTSRGFGLGLPIAQQIVKLHGGEIIVESAPGTGSTFQIVLPAGDQAGGV